MKVSNPDQLKKYTDIIYEKKTNFFHFENHIQLSKY